MKWIIYWIRFSNQDEVQLQELEDKCSADKESNFYMKVDRLIRVECIKEKTNDMGLQHFVNDGCFHSCLS